VSTLEQLLDTMATPRRFQTALLTGFAIVALLLAAVGVYGVMHYLVTQRATEIGIRLALGASRANVFGLVLRQGMAVTTVGLGIGICVSFVLTRVLSSSLYGVTPTDPVTFVLSTFTLMAVAALACLLPAWSATRVEPHSADLSSFDEFVHLCILDGQKGLPTRFSSPSVRHYNQNCAECGYCAVFPVRGGFMREGSSAKRRKVRGPSTGGRLHAPATQPLSSKPTDHS
jgi:hypothetical protein